MHYLCMVLLKLDWRIFGQPGAKAHNYAIVQEGETMYGIADKYFLLNKTRICFDEFWYNVSKDNKHLTANRRYLQPGDVVTVNYYTVKNQ